MVARRTDDAAGRTGIGFSVKPCGDRHNGLQQGLKAL
jgi:hypothetical protein